jgi:hypothetical protein
MRSSLFQANRSRNPSTGTHSRTKLNLRSAASPHDREAFYYREDFSLAQREFLTCR